MVMEIEISFGRVGVGLDKFISDAFEFHIACGNSGVFLNTNKVVM